LQKPAEAPHSLILYVVVKDCFKLTIAATAAQTSLQAADAANTYSHEVITVKDWFV
jgi:hypothetical protein